MPIPIPIPDRASGVRLMFWSPGVQVQKGRYVIEEVLSQGGFGIAYIAKHVLLDQRVVIKTPNASLRHDPDYPKFVKRFIQEGRILEKVSHPNIVRVRDLFQEQSLYCLVMDLVEGENLFNLVRVQGALSEDKAVGYIRQIAEALTVVHQVRLVHRDAHPGNIIIQPDGKAVLIDFGIAAEISPNIPTSRHPASPFAPPEQREGNCEPTIDVYTLSTSLYYTITGSKPNWHRHRNQVRLVTPRELNSNISTHVNNAIVQGMAFNQSDRTQSMQEWVKLLEPPTPTPIKPQPLPPPVNRQPVTPPPVTPKTPPVIQGMKSNSQRLTQIQILGTWLLSFILPYVLLNMAIDKVTGVFLTVFLTVGMGVAVGLGIHGCGYRNGSASVGVSWVVGVGVTFVLGKDGGVAGGMDLVAVVVLGVLVGIFVGIFTEVLLDSFCKFHTFLILTATLWLGLALGWGVHQLVSAGK